MSNNISKVRANGGLTKTAEDVIECVRIRGTVVDLRNVSPVLRAHYKAACRRVARHEAAKADLNALGQQILAEQSMKIAPRLSGHDAVAKLVGCKR
jgi:hypothetical protein